MSSHNSKAEAAGQFGEARASAQGWTKLTLWPDPGTVITRGDSQRVRVLVVDDHALLASTIATFLDAPSNITLCGVASSGKDALMIAQSEEPDVVLIDFNLPDVGGPTVAGMIRTGAHLPAIVFISADYSETALLDAIDAGATAFLPKSARSDQIVQAVRRAAQGEILIPVALFAKAIARRQQAMHEQSAHNKLLAQFRPQELEVLRLLAQALDTDAIADRLGIADHTVEWHLKHVVEKLQVHSKWQAVVEAASKGLIEV
jgi:DNA-binding NarL/FixJ family response regulator